jgi:hypothetical protein
MGTMSGAGRIRQLKAAKANKPEQSSTKLAVVTARNPSDTKSRLLMVVLDHFAASRYGKTTLCHAAQSKRFRVVVEV